MMTAKKTIGNFGEQLARNFLISRGYQIAASNHKIGRREIDIIAEHKGLVVFVEVKTLVLSGPTAAEQALTRRQIEILKSAIQSYCWEKKIGLNKARLDFIAIKINVHTKIAKIRHYLAIN